MTLSLLCAGIARAAPASAYGESAMIKLRPTDAAPASSGITLTAARNEIVSFQVAVNGGDAGASGLSATFSGLSGPGNIAGTDLRLFREGYLTTTTPSTPNVSTGRWPDALIPDVDGIAHEKRNAFPFDVPAGESRVLWVDVHVPDQAPAGTYSGSVKVTGQGLSAQIPVTLTVVSAHLPSTATLKTAFGITASQVCQAHTGTSDCGSADAMFALLGKYEQMALSYRVTLSNILPNVPDGDFTNLDRWVGPYLDGTAPNWLSGAKMTSAQFQGPRTLAAYQAFAQHFKAQGWFGRAFDYSADEPPYGSSFAGAASQEALVKQADPGFRTLVTTTASAADANGLTSDLDLIVPVVNFIDGTSAPYQGDQASTYQSFLSRPGRELWLYQSCMSHGCAYGSNGSGTTRVPWPSVMVDASAAQNRAMEWVSFLEGATGELYYETAMALPSAWTDQYRFAGNGDGTLFYPGTPALIGGQTDVPVASLRLALIRLGEEDYEWLELVSDAGDPSFARQVARTLLPSAHQVPADGTEFDRARLQLIARYLALTGGSASAATSTSSGQASASSGPAASTASSPTSSHVDLPGAAGLTPPGGGCVSGSESLSLLAILAGGGLLWRRGRPTRRD